MAEFIELRIQEMVPEVEEMEKVGLLSNVEMKKLIEKRREYEYKISKMLRSKQDFVSYVLYDCKLLSLLNIRRMNNSIKNKLRQIERPIILRVMKRLKFMSQVWSQDIDVWHLRISFLKNQNFRDKTSAAFSEQVRFHGDKIDTWISWAQWEIESQKNFTNARNILLSRAPAYHPNSPVLNRELFRLELLYLEYIKAKAEITKIEGLEDVVPESRKEVLNCGIPLRIYESVVKESGDPNFIAEFYDIADNFPFANHLKEKIFNDLLELYPNAITTWKLRANSSLKELCNEINKKRNTMVDPLLKIDKLFSVYDEGFEQIGEPFLDCYVSELLSLLYKCWKLPEYHNKIASKLLSIFENNSSVLNVWHYLTWYLLSSNMKKKKVTLKRILDQGEATHPESNLLRLASFKFFAGMNKKDKTIISEFKKSFGEVSGKECLEAWNFLIDSLRLKKNKVAMFKEGITRVDTCVAKHLKSQYLDFRFKASGLQNSRKLFKKLCYLPPFSSHFHATMLLQEMQDLSSLSLEDIRRVFDIAIPQFGKKHVGLWLTYFLFERNHGDGSRINTIKEEAEKVLEPSLYLKLVDLEFFLEPASSSKGNSNRIFVMPEEKQSEVRGEETDNCWGDSILENLFDEAPSFPYSVAEERKTFFAAIAQAKSETQPGKKDILLKQENDDEIWEALLKQLHGEKVSLAMREVHLEHSLIEKDAKKFIFSKSSDKKKSIKLSDQLRLGETFSGIKLDEGIEKILKNSATLQPEFLQQKQLLPYRLSKRSIANIRKKKQKETTGKGWFDMKAPELTEETKRDLEVLKMRSVLAPDRHYKRNDMKETPKFFHIGKVIDSPMEHFSSRIPNKKRKRTIAEELLHDEQVLIYQKKKYAQIGEQQEKRRKLRVSHQKMPNANKSNKRSKIKKK